MMARAGNRLAVGATFIRAAWGYWLGTFPHVRRELLRWRCRARTIPDPLLRETALAVQVSKRGNLDGSAAFAAFAPHAHRLAVIRAQVVFQAIYDYVDTVAEQARTTPVANGYQLHSALLRALDPDLGHADYYAYNHRGDDADYLKRLVDVCRAAYCSLSSNAVIATSTRRLAKRIVIYQSLNLTDEQGGHDALARWARLETPPNTGLRWWETAASAGSSLGIFALLTTAARPATRPYEITAIENTYFPWVGSLHSLLDSLIDLPEDTATQQHNLVTHYLSPADTATNMRRLATESICGAGNLPNARQHLVVLASMAAHYLSAPEANLPHALRTKALVLDTMGNLAIPATVILNLRRIVGAWRGASSSARANPIAR
jgi:tetraprenyl-beta-curcumene synthase